MSKFNVSPLNIEFQQLLLKPEERLEVVGAKNGENYRLIFALPLKEDRRRSVNSDNSANKRIMSLPEGWEQRESRSTGKTQRVYLFIA